MDQVVPDHVVPAAKLGTLLAEITATALPAVTPVTDDRQLDAEVAVSGLAPVTADDLPAAPAGYGCPSCGGSLFEMAGKSSPRFRCRVGHAWSAESLLDEQAIALEGALWMALRALEEKSALSRRMADERFLRASTTGHRFQTIAEDAETAGATLRRLIAELGSTTTQERDTAPPADRPDDLPGRLR